MLSPFSYVRPESLEEAIQQASAGQSVLHAGGTDLIPCLREHVFEADQVVSLSALKNLRDIKKDADGRVRIGALTTIARIAQDPLLAKTYPALSQAASEVASPQLRNQGTLGGNLCQKPRCWYYRGDFHCLRKGGNECFAEKGENAYHCIFGGENCFIVHPSDTAPALAALEAQVRTRGPRGERSIPLEAFHVLPSVDFTKETVLEPGEIVTEILLPPPAEGLKSSYRKVRARRSWDFALAGVALAIAFKGPTVAKARVFLSGAAPVPWRSQAVEDVLTGKPLTPETLRQASEAVIANARPLEQNGYKIPLFKALIAEQLQALA